MTETSDQAPRLPPKRPYLLRALYQWMTDNGQTPHLVVDATLRGVAVPEEHVEEGRIVLNVSYSATQQLEMGNEEIVFQARFGGTPRRLRVPVAAVLGIYARESGEGLVFPAEEYALVPPSSGPDEPPEQPAPGRPTLRVVR